ncbi:MAG: hypothetical protein ABIA93_03725, partial [Candidatus Woesearchaeota archaeon]
MSELSGERVADLGVDAKRAFVASPPTPDAVTIQVASPAVLRATDPVISPTYSLPGDFAAQYPTPLDPTEIIAMCEEITLWKYIPEYGTGLKQHTWRELNELDFTSGSTYIAFADGYCPEEYDHDGDNTTVTLKNYGAKKSLGISDIMHSQAVASANWNGINTLVGGFPSGEGLPGASDMATFQREHVANLKEKELRLGMALVLNGLDRQIVLGDAGTNSLEMNGIEQWADNVGCSMHTGSASLASGTFSAATFDRWLAESCAKPTVIMGHSTAIQEMLSGYFQLGFAGSQVVNFSDGGRITPGFNFAGFVNTGIGRLEVVADNNFTKADA